MPSFIRGPKDFWAGVLYVLVGGGAVLIAAGDYPMGRGGRMGPGYFPVVLGLLLLGFGAVSIARSVLRHGAPVGEIAWKPLLLVTGATALFGVLLPRAGLVAALLALALLSASASSYFRFDPRAAAGLVALIAFCALVFVTALGVPLPLRGTWFGG